MKDSYHQVSLVKLCWLIGITRQAYCQHLIRFEERSIETHLVLQQVQAIRKNHRRMGGRKLYEKLLRDNDIQISMTENGDPRENAIAGRIIGIIKNEYLIDYQLNNINEANEFLGAVVNLYNEEIPHLSIGLLPPNQVHNDNLKTEQLWKNYYPKKDNIVNPLQDINKNVNIS